MVYTGAASGGKERGDPVTVKVARPTKSLWPPGTTPIAVTVYTPAGSVGSVWMVACTLQ
jgi:hypothetical protein